MVLESLISAQKAENHPKEMFFFGMIYSFIAVIIAYWVFNEYSSLLIVFLTTMSASPLIYNIIKYEEKKDTQDYTERNLLREHKKALSAMLWLFIGVTVMFTIVYVVVPDAHTSNLFEAQTDTIMQINGKATEEITSSSILVGIVLNNIRVLVFCILFSFLYGIGALFILNWNASVIAVALGGLIKEQIYQRALESGSITLIGYIHSVKIGIMRYSIHGIPEIFAYIIAGLAGGIISVAVINYDINTKNFEKIVFDVSNLLTLSLAVLLVAGLLEVYVTPLFF